MNGINMNIYIVSHAVRKPVKLVYAMKSIVPKNGTSSI